MGWEPKASHKDQLKNNPLHVSHKEELAEEPSSAGDGLGQCQKGPKANQQ